jgi:hypothetical protein
MTWNEAPAKFNLRRAAKIGPYGLLCIALVASLMASGGEA